MGWANGLSVDEMWERRCESSLGCCQGVIVCDLEKGHTGPHHSYEHDKGTVYLVVWHPVMKEPE